MPDTSPATGPPTTLAQAVAGVEARIAGAPVRTKPFPHMVIDGILPAAVRRSLDTLWPTGNHLNASNYFQRGELRLSALAAASPPHEQAFWNALRHLTAAMGRAVRLRLDRHLAEKFRPLAGPDGVG